MPNGPLAIAIDTGGTFTDCVYLHQGRLEVLKIFSTPSDPGLAVKQAVAAIAGEGTPSVRHGTTVGTNAVLERKGARVAFVTTDGFEDTISIGRQARTHLYDWFASPPPSIVARELSFGVRERTSPAGEILCEPAPSDLAELVAKIRQSGAESIAVSLLFSFANSHNECQVGRALSVLGIPVSLSHRILPEFREYERASTVALNAYLAPKVSAYLDRLETSLEALNPRASFEVMQSSGGIIPARFASEQPVRTVLSGPAGGVMGAYQVARLAGFDRIIAFDMGGTSTDVSLVDARTGGPRISNESVISGMPVGVPTLDIHTVGAGGGSLAYFDDAGLLHVGPQSAGAQPGPICYGRGTEPTVSDANLLLGRLDPDHFLGGKLQLDGERTRHYLERGRQSVASVEIFAAGIVSLAEAVMERAIRLISVERGYDPAEFTLVAFGGAGPLHACALARTLRIPRVLVPNLPGALSALGILLADAVRDYSKTVMLRMEDDFQAALEPVFCELEAGAESDFRSDPGAFAIRSLDLRYAGQGYELNVPAGPAAFAQFHAAHRRRYGYADESKPVEAVNARLRVTAPAETFDVPKQDGRPGDGAAAIVKTRNVLFAGQSFNTPVYARHLLDAGDRVYGPAVIVEYSATTVVPPASIATVDSFRNLLVEVQ